MRFRFHINLCQEIQAKKFLAFCARAAGTEVVDSMKNLVKAIDGLWS